ncbi:uncharacterized protein LOC130719098 [Lotus japonicus]|uniref:uncharacterized protein LOC130719098 n=1 Tax=Lotus japonicus TaxID=34305 RepID=UPI002587B282|nr:uncharacterized protein LOC130719098 [Lotus japonicus]
MGPGIHEEGTRGNAFRAEAKALREGLQTAWNQGTQKLLCETGCKELVDILRDDHRVATHPQVILLQEIRSFMTHAWQLHLSWTPRESNQAADWLAKHSYRGSGMEITTLDAPGPELQVLILQDALGIT